MVNNPLISIITVVLNAGSVIEETILSVKNQSYKNIEFIIIDGGSTDATLQIIGKYRLNISLIISEPDRGVYDAMNKGIEHANGDWIYFLGAGDILLNVLDRIAPLLTNPTYLYYGNVFKLDEQKIYDGYFSAYKLSVKNISHQAIFYPSMVFQKYKFNLDYKILADYSLNMHCFGDKQISFQYLSEVICNYQGNGFSAKNPVDQQFFKDKYDIIHKNFPPAVYWYALIRNRIARWLKPGYTAKLIVNE